MKMPIRSTFVCALLLACAPASQAATLLPAASGDRVAPVPVQGRQSAIDTQALDRTPVQASWKQAGASITSSEQTHRAESREFWQDLDGSQLQRGVSFALTAPGAVVRISPVASSRAVPIDVRQLQLSRDGQPLDNQSAIASVINASDRAQGAVEFPEGSSAFRFDAAAGTGTFTLKSAQASGRYLLHVYDVGSPVRLSAQASRDTFFAGEEFAAAVRLDGAAVHSIAGTLRGPDGRLQDVRLTLAADGSHAVSGRLTLPALGASRGLYELHVGAAAGRSGELRRDVRTAFAVAAPTARLDGSLNANDAARGGLVFDLGVQVGSASRYAVEATLYVDNAAFATAQSAAWLEPGNRRLALNFDAALFEKGLPARYELRDLRLLDQAQLVTLERRALAFSGSATAAK